MHAKGNSEVILLLLFSQSFLLIITSFRKGPGRQGHGTNFKVAHTRDKISQVARILGSGAFSFVGSWKLGPHSIVSGCCLRALGFSC